MKNLILFSLFITVHIAGDGTSKRIKCDDISNFRYRYGHTRIYFRGFGDSIEVLETERAIKEGCHI